MKNVKKHRMIYNAEKNISTYKMVISKSYNVFIIYDYIKCYLQ